MKDALSGKTRTWPYGTKKRVEVLGFAQGISKDTQLHVEPLKSMKFCITCECEIREPEGFILTGVSFEGIATGETYEIEFKKGGPLGAYWDFCRDTDEQAASTSDRRRDPVDS